MRRKERQIKENSDIESIILRCDVCRIAFADNNTPYIVTMNFGYQKGEKSSIYFHCAPEGRKIDLISGNNYVCFEMDTDHHLYTGEKDCDWGMNYSSVVGYGRITIVSEKEEWVEVVGVERRKSGWILRSNLTTGAEDVAVATLAQKDLLDKEGNIIKENLPAFIESLPSANSQLARYLQDQMTNQVESAIEESIQEYEEQEEGEGMVVEDEE